MSPSRQTSNDSNTLPVLRPRIENINPNIRLSLSSPVQVKPPIFIAASSSNAFTREMISQENQNEYIARLSPLKRWIFIAKYKTVDFIAAILAVVISVYSLIRFLGIALAWLYDLVIPEAHAQFSGVPVQNGADYTPYMLLTLGLVLVWCMAVYTFSKDAKKTATVSDILKTIVGAVLGFFTAKKV